MFKRFNRLKYFGAPRKKKIERPHLKSKILLESCIYSNVCIVVSAGKGEFSLLSVGRARLHRVRWRVVVALFDSICLRSFVGDFVASGDLR